MSASYQVRADVAIVTLDNPPVNGLSYAVRKGVMDGLDRALGDAAVRAIVIAGAGKTFSAGADIREFGGANALREPSLHTVIAAIESSAKPVVAALHGMPLPRHRTVRANRLA